MNRSSGALCQLCSNEPGVHQFHGRVPALIGEECLKRAQRIHDDAIAARFSRVAATRKSRALPSRKCAGCEQTIVRVGKRGPIPKWCDGCNPHPSNRTRRRHRVPVVEAAVA